MPKPPPSSPKTRKPRELTARQAQGPIMRQLYRRAAAQLRKQRQPPGTNEEVSQSETDPQRLLHELQVHQVELELQNEELKEARDRMESLLEKYTDLYDFAPVGYFAFTVSGVINHVNLTGASLVRIERSRLVGRSFGQLISAEQRPVFYSFLKQVFASQTKQSADFELLRPGQPTRTVNIEAQCLLNGQECRAAVIDITERKQAEEMVRVSEIRYRRLFEAAHDGVLLLDPDTCKITDANPFMTQLLGYPHTQLIGKELFEIGLLEDETASREMFEKLKRQHEVRYEDLPLETQRGRHQEVEVVANLYREGGHSVIQCNIRDITQRKRTEHELSEKARLLDLSHDAIIVRDMAGYIRYWNHGAEELYGWSRGEVLGKISHNLLHTKFPIPLKQMTEELHRTDRWIGELVHTKRDGQRITVLVRKTLDRDRRGIPMAVLENITDITERKAAEDALRRNEALFAALVEQAPVGVLVMDDNFLLQQVNPVALLDFKKIKPLIGRDFFEIMRAYWPKQVAAEITTRFRHTMKTGEPYQVPEFTQRRRDTGALESYEWQTQRVTLPAGAQGLVCFFNNITKRKLAEDAQRRLDVLTASNRKLEKEIVRRETVEESLRNSERHQSHLLDQSRRMQEELRFLSRQVLLAQEEERQKISRELHDVIAQTLTGINIRLASLTGEAGVNSKHLNRTIAQTQKLVARSVHSVHEFARELRPAVLDDLGLIPALHSFVKIFSKRTRIYVAMRAFAGVEALDIAKRTVLYRVAQEALNNVARHAHATRVELSLEKLPASVGLQIKDNGRSFSVARTLRANHGKRLGLLGMRERLEMVGGTFQIESAADHGTTIIAQIPLGKAGGGRKTRSQSP